MNAKDLTVMVKIKGVCATCKHWHQPQTDYPAGMCARMSEDNAEASAAGNMVLGVHPNAYAYRDGLYTTDDFGCTLYEAREAQQ